MLVEELETSRPSRSRRLVHIQPDTRNGIVYADALEVIPGTDVIGRSSQSSELSPAPVETFETFETTVQTNDERVDRELILTIKHRSS